MFTILAMTCSAMRMFSPVAQGAPRTTMREAHGPMYWPTMALLPAKPPVARITPPLVISSTRWCFFDAGDAEHVEALVGHELDRLRVVANGTPAFSSASSITFTMWAPPVRPLTAGTMWQRMRSGACCFQILYVMPWSPSQSTLSPAISA